MERVVALADFFWSADQVGGAILLTLLVGTGLYLTIRLRLPQIRHFRHAIGLTAGRYDDPEDPGEVTHFQALSAALSGTVGIGNIAGVATAIYFGGPGATFWLWVTGALGMATKMTECTLAQRFRVENPDGSVSGGPMYTISRGLGRWLRPLAPFFALMAVLASFGIGNMVQANTVAEQLHATALSELGVEVPRWATGLVLATILALVIVGGIRRIGKVASMLVPFMALLYLAGALVVLAVHVREIPEALGLIMRSAFTGTAATGGFIGATVAQAIRWGVARGTFSNEAGLGSAPIAHAAARTKEPVREGMVALLEPFVDTVCICSLTALCIIVTGVWHEKAEAQVPLAGETFYREPVETPEEAAPAARRLEGVLRVVDGSIQGTAYFFHERGSVERPRIVARGEPWSGALQVDDGRLVGALVQRDGSRLVPVSPQELAELRLEGRMLHSGPTMTAAAFNNTFPGGRVLVTVVLVLFAFSTAVSWSYYGDRCIAYLLGMRAVLPYRIVYSIAHLLGSIFAVKVVWAAADVANAMMALPNLICLWALAPLASQMVRAYLASPASKPSARTDRAGASRRGR